LLFLLFLASYLARQLHTDTRTHRPEAWRVVHRYIMYLCAATTVGFGLNGVIPWDKINWNELAPI